MTVDLGSPILDVAFALAFVFFLLSLVVSALSEFVAWAVSLRHRGLESGIRGLIGDASRADRILAHPLVQTDLRGKSRKHKPSYVSASNFTMALIDDLTAVDDGVSLKSGKAWKQVKSAVIGLRNEPDLKRQLTALIAYGGDDLKAFRGAAERWFDEAMDRVSGWYRRWSQAITCLLAVVVAIGLNVDSLRVADRLANDETLRSSVVKAGDEALAKSPESTPGTEPAGSKPESVSEFGDRIGSQIDKVDGLGLPIGWGAGNTHVNLSTVLGWLVTAIAISLGAPFWFDALGRLARLRTSGPKPDAAGPSPDPKQAG